MHVEASAMLVYCLVATLGILLGVQLGKKIVSGHCSRGGRHGSKTVRRREQRKRRLAALIDAVGDPKVDAVMVGGNRRAFHCCVGIIIFFAGCTSGYAASTKWENVEILVEENSRALMVDRYKAIDAAYGLPVALHYEGADRESSRSGLLHPGASTGASGVFGDTVVAGLTEISSTTRPRMRPLPSNREPKYSSNIDAPCRGYDDGWGFVASPLSEGHPRVTDMRTPYTVICDVGALAMPECELVVSLCTECLQVMLTCLCILWKRWARLAQCVQSVPPVAEASGNGNEIVVAVDDDAEFVLPVVVASGKNNVIDVAVDDDAESYTSDTFTPFYLCAQCGIEDNSDNEECYVCGEVREKSLVDVAASHGSGTNCGAMDNADKDESYVCGERRDGPPKPSSPELFVFGSSSLDANDSGDIDGGTSKWKWKRGFLNASKPTKVCHDPDFVGV